jgi:hypothetical protein
MAFLDPITRRHHPRELKKRNAHVEGAMLQSILNLRCTCETQMSYFRPRRC